MKIWSYFIRWQDKDIFYSEIAKYIEIDSLKKWWVLWVPAIPVGFVIMWLVNPSLPQLTLAMREFLTKFNLMSDNAQMN